LLGIRRTARDFARYLAPGEAATLFSSNRSKNDTVQGRTRIHVNESGLYSLIFKSNKPEAKRFRRWVTGEVLPAIKRTGGYQAPSAPALGMAPPTPPEATLDISSLTHTQRLLVNSLVEQMAGARP